MTEPVEVPATEAPQLPTELANTATWGPPCGSSSSAS